MIQIAFTNIIDEKSRFTGLEFHLSRSLKQTTRHVFTYQHMRDVYKRSHEVMGLDSQVPRYKLDANI